MFKKVDPKVGGRLHTGRSRNDVHATEGRMEIRKTVWDIAGQVAELQELLLLGFIASMDMTMILPMLVSKAVNGVTGLLLAELICARDPNYAVGGDINAAS